MSEHLTYRLSDGPPRDRGWPSFRALGLFALGVIEILVLSLAFDATALAHEGRGAAGVVARLFRYAPAACLAGVVATGLFGGRRLLEDLRREEEKQRSRRVWPVVVLHVACCAGFAGVTWGMLSGRGRMLEAAGFWIGGWVALGLATAAAWALALLPPRAWATIVRGHYRAPIGGLLLGLAAVAVGRFADKSWNRLGLPTMWLAERMLRPILPDTVYLPDHMALGTRDFIVTVAPSCSGYMGIIIITAFTTAYLVHHRRSFRFPNALLLIPLGALVMWVANAVRIAALIVLGARYSPELALGGFHSQAGWLAILGVGLAMHLLARRVRFFAADRTTPRAQVVEPGRWSNPTAAYLGPLLAIIATSMVTAALTSGFDWFYPLRVVVAAVVLLAFRRQYPGLLRGWTWAAFAYGVLVFAIWIALDLVITPVEATTDIPENLAKLPRTWAVAWLVFRVLGSVVTVPLAEELAFRGYLLRRLASADFERLPYGRMQWLPLLVSSVLFGALHGRWIAGTLAGVIYGVAVYRSGRLSEAIVAHAITNALIAALVLIGGYWSHWS